MVEIDEKQIFSIIQKANETGKIKIGINEVTKAIERKQAKLVVNAADVSPVEIVAHLPNLCKEMGIIHSTVSTKSELGASVNIKSTTAIAILDAGSAKKELDAIEKELSNSKKEEKVEE